jgi:hypothetical protein
MSLPIGSQQITTSDAVIGTSGKKIRLYGLIVRSDGDGASVVNVYNGTSTSDTLMDVINVSAASTSVRVMYCGGLYLGSGCFIDVDGNTAYVTAIYEQENA